jgi:hypothetical protein
MSTNGSCKSLGCALHNTVMKIVYIYSKLIFTMDETNLDC